MSADTGIYIAQFPDGYRVCYAQAIENIDFSPVGSPERKEQLKNYFGGSKVYTHVADALNAAHQISPYHNPYWPL